MSGHVLAFEQPAGAFLPPQLSQLNLVRDRRPVQMLPRAILHWAGTAPASGAGQGRLRSTGCGLPSAVSGWPIHPSSRSSVVKVWDDLLQSWSLCERTGCLVAHCSAPATMLSARYDTGVQSSQWVQRRYQQFPLRR